MMRAHTPVAVMSLSAIGAFDCNSCIMCNYLISLWETFIDVCLPECPLKQLRTDTGSYSLQNTIHDTWHVQLF